MRCILVWHTCYAVMVMGKFQKFACIKFMILVKSQKFDACKTCVLQYAVSSTTFCRCLNN